MLMGFDTIKPTVSEVLKLMRVSFTSMPFTFKTVANGSTDIHRVLKDEHHTIPARDQLERLYEEKDERMKSHVPVLLKQLVSSFELHAASGLEAIKWKEKFGLEPPTR